MADSYYSDYHNNIYEVMAKIVNSDNLQHLIRKIKSDMSGLESRIYSPFTFKGSCTFEELPATGQEAGDFYDITNDFTLDGTSYPAGTNVSWDETSWQVIPSASIKDIKVNGSSVVDENGNAHITIPSTTEIQSSLATEIHRAQTKEGELQEAIADQNEEIEDFKETITDQVNNYQPIQITGNVTNAADEEDLTSENGLLKIKNRSALNGMGYVILRRGSSFASQVTLPNTIYEVRYNFDLNGATALIPAGCTLKFNGGELTNGTLTGNSTVMSADEKQFVSGCELSGSWKIDDNFAVCYTEAEVESAIANTAVSLIKIVGQIEMSHSLSIDRDGLCIIGESVKTSKLRFQKTYDGIILNKPKCKLSNLTIGNARVGIIVNSNTCLIENCSIGQCYLGVAFRSAFISRIINSYIEQNYVGVYATGENYEAQIDKCRIDNNLGGIGIVSSGSNTPIISDCTIEGNRDNDNDKFGVGIVLGGFLGVTSIRNNFFEKNGETAESVDVLMWNESISAYTDYSNLLSKVNTIIATHIPDDLIISGRPKVRDCMIGTVNISNNRFSLTPNAVVVAAIKANVAIADNYYFGAKQDVFPTGLKPTIYYSANSNAQSVLKVYRNIYIQSDATKIVNTSDERGAGIFIFGDTDNVFIEDDNYFNNPIPKDFVASNLEIMGLSNTKYSSGTNNYEYYTHRSYINSVTRYHKSVSSDYRYIMYGNTELTDANVDFSDKVLFVYGFGKLKGRTSDNQYRDYDLNGWTLIDLTLYQNGGRLVAWPNVSLICGVLVSKDLNYNSIDYPVTIESMPNNQINLDQRNVGVTSLSPTGVEVGFQYFDTILGKPTYWQGTKWVDAKGQDVSLLDKGTTANRPTLTSTDGGFCYFDTNLGKPIYWQGTKWVDATGADLT